MSAIDSLKYVIFSTYGKIIMLIFFILFIYQPITDICLFFGIDNTFVYMYSAWLIFIFLLIIILRSDNGIITYTKDVSVPATTVLPGPITVPGPNAAR